MTIPTWFIWLLLGLGFGILIYAPKVACDPQTQGCVVTHNPVQMPKGGQP